MRPSPCIKWRHTVFIDALRISELPNITVQQLSTLLLVRKDPFQFLSKKQTILRVFVAILSVSMQVMKYYLKRGNGIFWIVSTSVFHSHSVFWKIRLNKPQCQKVSLNNTKYIIKEYKNSYVKEYDILRVATYEMKRNVQFYIFSWYCRNSVFVHLVVDHLFWFSTPFA
jgi:hypothetical protein